MIQWLVVCGYVKGTLLTTVVLVLVAYACDRLRPGNEKPRIDPKLSVRKSAQHVLFLPAHKPSNTSSLQPLRLDIGQGNAE